MDLVNVIILVVLLSNIFLGAIILRSNHKSSVNLSYSIVILTILIWSVPMIFYRTAGDSSVLLWARILYAGAATTMPSFLLFSYYFPRGKVKVGVLKYVLIVFGASAFIYLSLFTDTIVFDASVVNGAENTLIFGKGFILYVAAFFYYFAHAYLKLFKRLVHAKGTEKIQVSYVVWGYFLASNLAFVTNLTLPWFGIFALNWMGQALTIIMVSATTYAIVRYRFLDIKLIITRSVLYFLLVATVTSFFTFVIFLIREIIVVQTRFSELSLIMAASFIVVIALDPLKKFLSRVTDDIFYKSKIDYDQVLKNLSLIIAREIDMEVLLSDIRQGLVEQLKLRRADMFVNLEGLMILGQTRLEPPHLDAQVAEFVLGLNDLVVLEEYGRKVSEMPEGPARDKGIAIAEKLDKMNWHLIVPVRAEKDINGLIVLDYKLSGDPYSREDINFLNILAPQIAVAIEKSRLYEEIGNFNKELQQKIDRATVKLKRVNADLGERNKFLTVTQNISNLISRTLDINHSIQTIADSIASELGYIGGILSFVDEEGKYMYPAAITRSATATKALALLPHPVSTYKAEIRKRENLGVQILKTGSAMTSTSFADFFSPPLEREIAEKIQKAINIVTVVGVPIYSENKIIGVIHYLLAIPEKNINHLDYEMMNSLADQIGIIYRNVKLYQALETTNESLQEANVHLKQLDKAKSEFLSIASHQLRTPTSAIKGYLSMILEGDFGKIPVKQQKVIKDVYESAGRLARLINIFLNVSRIEAGRFKLTKIDTDMNKLIEGVFTELKQQAELKGLKLKPMLPKKAPIIFVDTDKVREVVLNLVDNAIKYTHKGYIEIHSELTDEAYTFWTKDTGMGIRPDEVSTLFRKFVRGTGVAQVNTQGSGLGLYIAQRVIKEHGGEIWAESEGLDKGSVFKFVIPIIKERDKSIQTTHVRSDQ